jgi:hypothetical protein
VSDAPDQSLIDSPPDVTLDPSDPTADASGFFAELSSLASSVTGEATNFAASVKTSLAGVSKADVAAGFDVSTLTRAQRVQLLLDGATGGVAPNPWSVGFDLDEATSAQIVAQGGATLVFDVSIATPLALFDKLAPPRFALVWDDELPASQGTIDPAALLAQPPLVTLLNVPPSGRRLTLWVDSTLTTTFRKMGLPTDFDAIVAAENAALDARNPTTLLNDAGNKVSGLFDGIASKFFDVEQEVGLALVVVLGVAVFLFIESGGPKEVANALKAGA